jgi:hypothetical protein
MGRIEVATTATIPELVAMLEKRFVTRLHFWL